MPASSTLANGIPSDDTFARVLARLDPAAFEKWLLSWIQAVQEISDHRFIAIDGKTLRGSYDRGDGKAAIHMVSAWATENKLSLGQVVVDQKSNEITAIPELLRVLELSGAIVTIDAMGCRKEIAHLIRERGGDDVPAVKQNQPTLSQRVEEAIDVGLEQDTTAVDVHQTVETGHGRDETRTYVVFPAGEAVDPDGLWQDLKGVGMAVTESTDPQGKCRCESRYYILSVLLSSKDFAEAARGHWGIENHLQLATGRELPRR